MGSGRADDGGERAWGGTLVPAVLAGLAAMYFVGVWAEAAKAGTAARWFPAPIAYFMQVAALFPGAARHTIDYRVEGWRCRDKTWAEIDVTPWFPIDADNKESRFYRAIHFYGDAHPHRQTLRALDEFIVSRFDGDAIDAAAQGRGGEATHDGAARGTKPWAPPEPIGGVRFVRLHVPFGKPGDGSARYERKSLDTYPAEQRKDLYYTPESKREERCARLQ